MRCWISSAVSRTLQGETTTNDATTLPMYQLRQITEFLKSFAPLELAESWDNVGLLLGDESAEVGQVMTCLTLTSDVAEEALAGGANLILTHHPILFRPVQKLTTATSEGRMVLKLLKQGIAVYSPHTAFDSARDGINQSLAEQLGLQNIQPLRRSAVPGLEDLGAGRWGRLQTPVTLRELIAKLRKEISPQLQHLGDLDRIVHTIGIGCGSAAEFLKDAERVGCDVYVTGEARFHAGLEARDREIALVLAGHFNTERPAIERLAEKLKSEFPGLHTWASRLETDPLVWSAE
ncbi:Nif3-like dinuclear metal center hexameric protein [Planctomicrobium sp. SH661]|uniref:Nif3-like dinuclear metal center hexameric protein n=1 Tax=Planctomicrobium sp. SH661 TaxID=3448124 RepID=UPI003F5BAF20